MHLFTLIFLLAFSHSQQADPTYPLLEGTVYLLDEQLNARPAGGFKVYIDGVASAYSAYGTGAYQLDINGRRKPSEKANIQVQLYDANSRPVYNLSRKKLDLILIPSTSLANINILLTYDESLTSRFNTVSQILDEFISEKIDRQITLRENLLRRKSDRPEQRREWEQELEALQQQLEQKETLAEAWTLAILQAEAAPASTEIQQAIEQIQLQKQLDKNLKMLTEEMIILEQDMIWNMPSRRQ